MAWKTTYLRLSYVVAGCNTSKLCQRVLYAAHNVLCCNGPKGCFIVTLWPYYNPITQEYAMNMVAVVFLKGVWSDSTPVMLVEWCHFSPCCCDSLRCDGKWRNKWAPGILVGDEMTDDLWKAGGSKAGGALLSSRQVNAWRIPFGVWMSLAMGRDFFMGGTRACHGYSIANGKQPSSNQVQK